MRQEFQRAVEAAVPRVCFQVAEAAVEAHRRRVSEVVAEEAVPTILRISFPSTVAEVEEAAAESVVRCAVQTRIATTVATEVPEEEEEAAVVPS